MEIVKEHFLSKEYHGLITKLYNKNKGKFLQLNPLKFGIIY